METLDRIWKKGKDFLGVKYPVICGGMTWISDFELVKAVGDSGAFPVFAGGNMPPDLFEEELDKCIKHIKTPFAVNLITIAPFYKDHLEIVIAKKIDFVIFAGSFPKKDAVQRSKDAGIKVMAFASTESIAKQMIGFGVDALILEGNEAGGHIGHVSLTILLQQVLFQFRDFPVFVAGGIATGQMIAHLLVMGAYGCQLGTRFVMTEECTASPAFKKAFIKARAREAISTPQYDSKLPVVAVRAIRNKSMTDFGKLQLHLLKELEDEKITKEEAQYKVEEFWVGSLRKAVIDGDVTNGSLMAGQSVGLVKEIKSIKKVMEDLITEATEELDYIKNVVC